MLLLLGAGVVANVILPKNKGFDGGWLLINFGWGLAVFAGVYVAYKSGAHLNPAVTIGLWTSGAEEFAPGIARRRRRTASSTSRPRWSAPLIGAALAFLAYKKHFDEDADAGTKLAVFSTGPAIRSLRLELRHRGHRHLRPGLRHPRVRARRPPGSARSPSPCSWSASAPASVAPPATPSTRPVTSARASRTPSCRSGARARATGRTPGCRSSAPSSAALIAGLVACRRTSSDAAAQSSPSGRRSHPRRAPSGPP